MADEDSLEQAPDLPGDGAEWRALRALLEIPSTQFAALTQVLSIPHTDRRSLVSAAHSVAIGVSRRDVDLALSSATGYLGGWIAAGRPGTEPIEERAAKRVFPDESESASRERARILFGSRSITLAAGALNAVISRGQEVAQLTLGLDLSPVEWEEPGSAMVVSFNLAFEISEPLASESRPTRRSIVLDLDDIRDLAAEIDRTLKRLDDVSRRLREGGTIVWGKPSLEGEND